ncbi:hypothetical protein [Geodermatophilus maliterrae]|uniref:Uncharacterized protein n=1 Tax=Geodermatophilus maliterrae TaxID=3162531 RepID=A0ABV3XA10_9ACTN
MIVQDDLVGQFTVDFAQACVDLSRARGRQQQKDTPAHRAAVRAGYARIDALLDSFLQASQVRRRG